MSAMNDNKERKLEITAKDVFDILIKRWLIIVLCGLVLASSFLLGTKLMVTPQYESVTKIFVLSKQYDGMFTAQDFQMSTFLTQDFAQLIKSRTVAEEVIDRLDLKMSPGALLGQVTVEAEDETRIITIVVRNADPETAQMMANTIREVSAKQIVNVMDMQAVNVVDEASLPTSPSTPKTAQNAILGGALGVLLAAAIILLQHYSDDTIKSTDDVEHYLNLNVLATIPTNEPGTSKKRGWRK